MLTESSPNALSRIYAQSLFELAQAAGGQPAIESTQGELEDILEIARANPQFNEFLSSRILPREKREASLSKILKGRVSDLVFRFLLTLNQKGRLAQLPSIVASFDQLVQASFGRIEVDVFTASPISSDELALIQGRLKQALGKEPVVHPYTDSAMIGGLKVQIGDQLIDASVASSLRKLKDRLDTDGAAKVRAIADRIIDSGASPNGRA